MAETKIDCHVPPAIQRLMKDQERQIFIAIARKLAESDSLLFSASCKKIIEKYDSDLTTPE